MRPDTSSRSAKRSHSQDEEFAFSDHLVFDNVRPSLPDPSNGRHILFVYVCLEALLILFGFLAHHHKASDFSCCNAWAVFIAFLFLGVQWPYYNEWCSKLGYTASWHRGNMFAPMFLYYILWVGWLFATLSMLAHNDGNDFFTINLSAMEGNELTAVVVCTITVIPGVFLGIAISHSYRNSLATHYYAPKEGAASLTHLSSRPHPTEGSFHYRNILGTMSRIALCENSAEAEQHMPYVYRAFVILMGVFYAFSIMTLAQNVSGFLITSIITGLVVFGINVRDGIAMFKTDSLKYRSWYRLHLLSPLYSVFNMLATYFFAMSSVFFRAGATTFGTSKDQWESLITDLDPTEKGYFAVLFILMIALAAMTWVLVNLHRKAWAEWTKSVDDGLDYTPAGDKLELAKREKRAARQASGVDRHQSGRRKAPTRQRSQEDDYYGEQVGSSDRVNVDVDDEDEYEEDEEQLEEEYAREVYGGGRQHQQQQRNDPRDFGGPEEYYDDQEEEEEDPRNNRNGRYEDE